MDTNTINVDNIEAQALIFSSAYGAGLYVVEATKTEDTLAFWDKYGQDAKRVDYHDEDGSGTFYAFWVADCFDPSIAVIRARSWESAYEAFCDEFSDWMKIDDTDLLDYVQCDACGDTGKDLTLDSIGNECRKDGCTGNYYPTCNMSGNGVNIDTESANGVEIRLLRVIVAE